MTRVIVPRMRLHIAIETRDGRVLLAIYEVAGLVSESSPYTRGFYEIIADVGKTRDNVKWPCHPGNDERRHSFFRSRPQILGNRFLSVNHAHTRVDVCMQFGTLSGRGHVMVEGRRWTVNTSFARSTLPFRATVQNGTGDRQGETCERDFPYESRLRRGKEGGRG